MGKGNLHELASLFSGGSILGKSNYGSAGSGSWLCLPTSWTAFAYSRCRRIIVRIPLSEGISQWSIVKMSYSVHLTPAHPCPQLCLCDFQCGMSMGSMSQSCGDFSSSTRPCPSPLFSFRGLWLCGRASFSTFVTVTDEHGPCTPGSQPLL